MKRNRKLKSRTSPSMQYVSHRTKAKVLGEQIYPELPKQFEIKLFLKVVTDLENLVNETDFEPEILETLLADLKLAKEVIRSRDIVRIATLSESLSAIQSTAKTMNGKSGSALAHYVGYQLGAFLKKFPFKGIDTAQPALDKFFQAERVCSLYNSENYKALVRMNDTLHQNLGGCIESIRADIENLLGAVPDVERVESSAFHGPGMTAGTDVGRGETTNYFKWLSLPYSVTAATYPYAKRIIESDPRWIGALDQWYRHRSRNRYAPIDVNDFWSRIFTIVDGSRITGVPKTAITDRTIALEPLMNVFIQLGVDRYMRRRLKKVWDMDLSSQSLNQDLAFDGSIDGTRATLDLKGASDTISCKICELYLPAQWYNLLLDLRSPKGEVQGKWISFDKISSMGNGFTFALETIIFGAITRHVMRWMKNDKRIAVYGDDIVVPTEAASSVIELLEYSGFSINTDKSFTEGPFRESCGSDYFSGYDVRPVFLTRPIKSVMDLFYIHNALVLREDTAEWVWGVHFKESREFIRKYIHKRFKNVCGPLSETLDGYLFAPNGIKGIGQGWWHLSLVAKPRKFNSNTDFFFRKLMVSLKGSADTVLELLENKNLDSTDKWDKNRILTTGNSFDVTKRDYTQIACVKKRIYERR